MTTTVANNMATPTVAPGSFLTLHYRLSGPAGDAISTFEGPPATLTLGTGELSPALETYLMGLTEGTRTTFEVPAGVAFGERSAAMQQWMARKELNDLSADGEEYAVGDVLHFPTPDGQGKFAGVIVDFKPDAVLLDFNHPLAGRAVAFEVHVIGVL